MVLEERLPQMDVWQCLAYGLSDGAFRLWVPCGKRYATITQPNLGNLRDALTPLAIVVVGPDVNSIRLHSCS